MDESIPCLFIDVCPGSLVLELPSVLGDIVNLARFHVRRSSWNTAVVAIRFLNLRIGLTRSLAK